MTNTKQFIETKEYKRFAEFCDACIKYKYIGICYGTPGVGKTLSSRHYTNWDMIGSQLDYQLLSQVGKYATKELIVANKLFYTAPAEKGSKISGDIRDLGYKMSYGKSIYQSKITESEIEPIQLSEFEEIELIIIDEIDRLKIQHLEQLRDIYDQHNLAMIFIGIPGIEKRLSRYPQLYSRIGFSHEFDKLSKDETHHILEYKWSELGIPIKLEDFSDYEAITSIVKITGGNFRLIHRLFTQIDRILEINQLKTVSVEVVEAARDSLVIGIK
ncbi:AAA family ATPase [Enterococcus plantarum]|uniref:AAA family ATPase n=1 Tax=Enterococcus plantarum TaxID=1077675 RepID=UPI001A8F2963|nr:AAA family ATPase [Enterococcus plantarum]MBO0465943.1 AAA family ATPase [Enterococcus plantarum]